MAAVRARVFALTWISYASYYLTRKNFSVTKASIQDSLGISQGMLGAIDVVYLTTYSIGQFVWGPIADRIGSRRVIGAGMLASAAVCALFGLSSGSLAFLVLWALNGLAQSTGWPANLKAITPWFPPERRGTVMGFWSTCYQFGSWVANPIAVAFIGVAALAWRGAYVFPAIIVAAVGVAVLLFLPERRIPETDPAAQAAFQEEVRRERARVLRTPLVWALGSAYFFMKLIRYVLFFWLPYFMRRELGYSVEMAGIVPNAFEIGGLVGAITAGFVSDRFFRGRRVIVGIIALLLLAAAMPLYAYLVRLGLGWNILGLAIVGFSLFGPDTLLSATAAQDVGGPAAAATAAGVINGLGSIGPIVGLALAPWMSQALGWTGYFSSLGIGAFIGALILIPFLRPRP